MQKPGGGPAFETADFEDRARRAWQCLKVSPETCGVPGEPIGRKGVALGDLLGRRRDELGGLSFAESEQRIQAGVRRASAAG